MKRNIEKIKAWQLRSRRELKRSRLNRVSKKRQKANRSYSQVAKEYLERNPYCHHCLELGIRPKRSTCVHHTAGRSGEMLTDTRFFMAVNDECHIIHPLSIHENVAKSRERGWFLPRGASVERKLELLIELRGEFDWVRMEVG